MKLDKIAILIPCFNESQTIKEVITGFKEVLPEATVYVYDNNSSDNTSELAKEAGAIVKYEYQQGKGNVIRRMFREIDAECYLLVDGDATYPPDAARSMVDLLFEKNVDMVVGDRLSSTYFNENKRPFHNFGNSLVRSSINFLFKSNIRDIMTGYRAFSYEFVKTFPVLSKGFEIETEMSIHAIDKNMLVENIIIDYRDRPKGSVSKLNTYSDGIKVIKTIFSLFRTYKPLEFFGSVSVLLIALAICFFVPIFIKYLQSGTVPNFPTLIVCGFSMIAGLISFFSGLILSSIKQKNLQDFEMELHKAYRDKMSKRFE